MKKSTQTAIFDFFAYTQTERVGVVVLLILIVLFAIFPVLLPIFKEKKSYNFTGYEREIAEFKAQLQASEENETGSSTGKYTQKSVTAELFPFDPNTASEAEFIRLGLSPKTAQTILKYRSKGGKFRKTEDFGKIYSISPEQFVQLKPYIQLPENSGYAKKEPRQPNAPLNLETFAFDPNTAAEADLLRLLPPKTVQSIVNYRTKGGKFRTKEDLKKIFTMSEADYLRLEAAIVIAALSTNPRPVTGGEQPPTALAPNTNAAFSKIKKTQNKIDINASTAEDFQQLPGIGVGFATRIVNQREKLGGFTSIEQVKETFGFTDSLFKKIVPQLQLGTLTLRKLKLNSAAAADLKNHPYLGWKLANLIVSYREQHGKYKTPAELKKIPLITPDIFDKISPYLSLE